MGWQGKIGQGERAYTDSEYARTVRAARAYIAGATKTMPLEGFARVPEVAGLEPRTIRAILADADGIEFVVCHDLGDEGGMYLAEFAEEGEGFTRNLLARAKSLAARAERRRAYAEQRLPRRQETLFP